MEHCCQSVFHREAPGTTYKNWLLKFLSLYFSVQAFLSKNGIFTGSVCIPHNRYYNFPNQILV
jgi:hypothetical protein